MFFISHYLYNWDAGNFALGVNNYNISMHQPHPPGYPIFIGLGKVLDYFFHDANFSLVLISLFFAFLAVLFLYFLVLEIHPKKYCLAAVTSLFLIVNPIFWFYRELASTYTVDAFIIIFLLWIFYKNKKNNLYLYLGSLVLGLAGGFRPTLIIFLLPLFCYNFFFLNKKKPTKIIISLIILFAAILLWLIPMILLTGGMGEYYKILHNLFSAAEASIPLMQNIKTFYGVLVVAINVLFIFLIKLKYRNLLLAIIAGLPALLVYTFMHFGQPGYVLILLPIFIYLSINGIDFFLKNYLLKILLVILLVSEASIFLFLNNRVSNPVTYPDTNVIVRKLNALDPWLFKFNHCMIKENDKKNKNLIDNILQEKNALIISVRNLMYKAPNGMAVRNDENYRQMTYYLAPTFGDVFEIAPNRDYYSLGTYENNEFATLNIFFREINLNQRVNKVIILAQKIDEKDMPTNLVLEKKDNYYIGSLENIDNFDFLGFKFIKQ